MLHLAIYDLRVSLDSRCSASKIGQQKCTPGFFFSAAVRANYYIYLFLFLLFCFERSLRYEYWGSKTTSFGNSKKKKGGQQWR